MRRDFMIGFEPDTIDKEKAFQDTYRKWRALIFKADIISVIAVFTIEVIMYFLLRSRDLILQPIPVYLARFLILPTIINITLLTIGYICIDKYKDRLYILNYVPIVIMSLLCIVVSCTHYVFAVTAAVYTIPVFVTVIFSDQKMTRIITAIGVIGVLLTAAVNLLLSESSDAYLIPESIVALCILLTAHKFSQILISYQKEKNDALARGYQEQLRMEELLNYDQKTGIYGSTAFSNSLSRTIDRCATDSLALAFLDIDDFKYVNDTYGHAAGDEVLVRLAAIIRERCGDRQLPGRFGGDEFAVLLVGENVEAYCALLEEMQNVFQQQTYDFTEQSITVSIGLAMLREGWDADTILQKADEAMYRSKENGKNQLTVFK